MEVDHGQTAPGGQIEHRRVDRRLPVGILDAWEIANRDFHKPRHIFSWKTVLHCKKDPEAIKACVRDNRDVSITLYRRREGGENPVPAAAAESRGAGWRKSPGQMSLAFAEADVA